MLKIDIFGHDILARTSTAFSLVFKTAINSFCRIRTVYSMVIQTFNMRKEIFKVGYQKPKSSPLQGIEPGSSCIVVLQLKTETTRKSSPLEGTEPGSLRPQRLFYRWITPIDYSCSSRRLAKSFVVLFTACFFLL